MEYTLYHYKAVVTAVYDADTITVDIDLGLRTWIRKEKVRLSRINAPEVRGVERTQGLLSKEFLVKLLMNKEIIIETKKDFKEKYGRYLGEIWIEQGKDNFINVNDLLVKEGFAVYKEY